MAKINPIRKYKTSKVDADFEKELRALAKERYMKNLEKQEPKLPEMTRLLRKTQGYKQSIFELKTKPRKEDLMF